MEMKMNFQLDIEGDSSIVDESHAGFPLQPNELGDPNCSGGSFLDISPHHQLPATLHLTVYLLRNLTQGF